MPSQIDDTKPVTGNPTTASVRANFTTAKSEITALQALGTGAPFLPLAGARMTGPMYLYNDPTDVMMPATKGYVDAHAGSGGGGGIPEAPADGKTYGRNSGAWVATVPLAGGTMTGLLNLSGPPTAALHAATKAYVDTMGASAAGAVQKAGDTMTGLLLLSANPAAPLGAATKQYVDGLTTPLAPLAAPTFTGIVTASGGRIIIGSPTDPALILNNTGTSQPVFGIRNSAGLLGLGLANPSTGAIVGNNFATMDQTGLFTFASTVRMNGGRLVISGTSPPNPAVTFINTGGGPVFSMFSSASGLYLGFADGNGVPTAPAYALHYDGSGNVYTYANLTVGGATTISGNVTAASMTLLTYGITYPAYVASPASAIGFGYSFSAPGVIWLSAGGVTAGSWAVNVSDERLKRDVEAVRVDPLAALRGVQLHRFNQLSPRNDPDDGLHRVEVGMIAQQIREVIPEVVIDPPTDDGFLSINPTPLIAYCIGAIQQLADRLAALESAS